MEELVDDLVSGLQRIASAYEEMYDTRVQERLYEVFEAGFVDNVDGNPYEVPEEMGMFTIEANIALREVLQDFLHQAIDVAYELGHDDPLDRREAMRSDDLAEFLGEDWWE